MRSKRTLAVTVLLCACLSACASISHDAADASRHALDPSAIPVKTTTSTTVPRGCVHDSDALKSLRPEPSLPAPGHMPVGSFMWKIQKYGKLRAGVDENTLGFSARDPLTGEINGFEVAIVREIARAIFGSNAPVQLKTVTTQQKVSFAANGQVDLTVSAISMDCERYGSVDFSTEYYTAQHKLLVPEDSDIKGVEGLRGRRVCVTRGSTSGGLLADKAPRAIAVERDARTDCLMALQLGEVDAYLSHDAILRGMVEQDSTMKIVGKSLRPQHYGIAIPKHNQEFVRFVNGVLERMRSDGTMAALYAKWLGSDAPPIPTPEYRDAG